MVNRRQFGYALIAFMVVSLGCAALVGFESSFLSKYVASAESEHGEAISMAMVRGTTASAPSEGSANMVDNTTLPSSSPDSTTASAQQLSAATTPLTASSSESGPTTLPTTTETTETTETTATADATPTSSSNSPSSTASTEESPSDEKNIKDTRKSTKLAKAKMGQQREVMKEEEREDEKKEDEKEEKKDEEKEREFVAEAAEAEQVEQEEEKEQYAEFDIEELMTPELIERIKNEKHDPLAPMEVHMLWVGDLSQAPRERRRYSDFGYKLVVHTDPEEILEGFHPHVLRAYKLAIPAVVGYDFLKFAMLYKYGGLSVDADTTPAILASSLHFPTDCDVVFGKEAQVRQWQRPIFRQVGGNTYGLNRPFQILNWAMAARKPRNPHVKWLMRTAMMHFFGLRDMELSLVQDISGSGLMSDYVALLHEQEGRNYPEVYRDESKYYPVQGLCLVDGYLHGGWIRHAFHGSWKPRG